jgi:farnesyl-diphosphate farnesyltransferase
MTSTSAPPDTAMLRLLRGVSRSFYLSIRLLPSPLRRPVAVGYLLARATDTIADSPGATARDRLQGLHAFGAALEGQATWAPAPALAIGSEDERALLDSIPQCLRWLGQLATEDQQDVRTVLAHITRGQRLDVERFGEASREQPRALESAAELDEYTYLVAGSVGEFWTRLGFRHLPAFAELPQEEMLALARCYGMGLQLINVLRDAGADLGEGRCYLPAGAAEREPWLARARDGLECGMRYAGALRSRRVRVASALPALIGARTLALLRAAGEQALSHQVKVPRSEVRGVLTRTALHLGGNAALQAEFRRLRA